MFDNIHSKIKIGLQEEANGEVRAKGKGRPKAPNMERMQIKIDKLLRARLRTEARAMGLSQSAYIAVALKSYHDKAAKRYRLVEV